MTRSGKRCEQAGVYESGCEDRTRIALMDGARFPTCRRHGEVAWALLESQRTRTKQPREPSRDRAEPEWQTHSGERCRNSGLYESVCQDRIKIAVMRGSRFPTCGNHGEVAWILVKGRRI